MKRLLLFSILFAGWFFMAKGQTIIIGNTTTTTCLGTLYDSGGAAGDYGPNENFTHTIFPGTPGQKIQVDFTSFNLGSGDVLTIYDGNAFAPSLAFSGTTSPGVVTSSAADGSLTFRFTSNSSSNGPGFEATVSCVDPPASGDYVIIHGESATVCSGTLYDPGYFSNYFHNTPNWTYTLFPGTPGQKIQVDFTSFNLGSGDVLTIYDGNAFAPSLPFTGTTSPGIVTSSAADGSLTFRFSSNSSSNGPGFEASISCVDPPASGDYVIIHGESATVCSGTLYDPGYFSNYFHNTPNWTYTLFPGTPGQKIQVDFTSFNLGSGDVLTIYDGNAFAPSLPFTGTTSPGIVTSSAADGSLTFRFSSNSSSNGPGFEASISCVDPPASGDYVIIHGESATVCSGTLYDPGYFSNYFHNTPNWTYTLFPGTPGQKIQVDFTSFNLGSGDVLTIYDGNAFAPSLAFSGTTSPGIVTSSAADGSLTFRFSSNSSSNGPGFEASISCVDPPASGDYVIIPGESATVCSGTLYDPGYFSNYFHNTPNWTYTLFPGTPGQKIQVDFTSFNLGSGDVLTIYDGNAFAPSLAFTGTTSPGIVTSSAADGSLTFRFSSNSSSNGPGFEASISCVDPPASGDYVIQHLKLDTTCSGTLYDPGYNNNYWHNIPNWTYTLFPGTPGQKIQVDFTSFNLGSGDVLTIYDGNAFAPSLAFSGTTSPGIVTSSAADGSLTFRFSSNSSSNGQGFEASISCVDLPAIGDFVIQHLKSDTTCTGTLYDPGYNNNYWHNIPNWIYTVHSAVPGERLTVDFTSFQLGSGDVLQIYDGPTAFSPLLGTFSGSSLPPSFTSSSCDGVLTFRFSSNSSSNGAGFEANLSCSSSGSGFSGAITNVGFNLDLTVSGGTAPYTYNWTGPSGFSATTEDISAPLPGTYTVEINSPSEPCPAFASYELSPSAIPTMGEWGLIILGLCLLNLGAIAVWRRRPAFGVEN